MPYGAPAIRGDETIQPHLDLFRKQREVIRRQMEDLQQMLDVLEFKCRYYETASTAGATAVPRNMPLEESPEKYREARRRMREIPKV